MNISMVIKREHTRIDFSPPNTKNNNIHVPSIHSKTQERNVILILTPNVFFLYALDSSDKTSFRNSLPLDLKKKYEISIYHLIYSTYFIIDFIVNLCDENNLLSDRFERFPIKDSVYNV